MAASRSAAAPPGDERCVICLESLGNGESLFRLPKCHHIFHEECARMMRVKWEVPSGRCPVCSQEAEGLTPLSALLNRAAQHQENKEWELCHELLQEAILVDPGNARVAACLGQFHYEAGEMEKAKKFFLEAHEKGEAKATFNLGGVFHKQGDMETAKKFFLEAHEKGDAEATFNLGVMFQDQGEMEMAKKFYLEAHEKGEAKATFNLGGMFHKQGDMETAKKFYREAHEKGDAYATYKLAWLRQGQGEVEKAEALFHAAHSRGHLSATLALAGWKRELGETRRAIELYTVAHARGDTEASFIMGTLHKELGEGEDAKSCFLRYLKASAKKDVQRSVLPAMPQRIEAKMEHSWAFQDEAAHAKPRERVLSDPVSLKPPLVQRPSCARDNAKSTTEVASSSSSSHSAGTPAPALSAATMVTTGVGAAKGLDSDSRHHVGLRELLQMMKESANSEDSEEEGVEGPVAPQQSSAAGSSLEAADPAVPGAGEGSSSLKGLPVDGDGAFTLLEMLLLQAVLSKTHKEAASTATSATSAAKSNGCLPDDSTLERLSQRCRQAPARSSSHEHEAPSSSSSASVPGVIQALEGLRALQQQLDEEFESTLVEECPELLREQQVAILQCIRAEKDPPPPPALRDTLNAEVSANLVHQRFEGLSLLKLNPVFKKEEREQKRLELHTLLLNIEPICGALRATGFPVELPESFYGVKMLVRPWQYQAGIQILKEWKERTGGTLWPRFAVVSESTKPIVLAALGAFGAKHKVEDLGDYVECQEKKEVAWTERHLGEWTELLGYVEALPPEGHVEELQKQGFQVLNTFLDEHRRLAPKEQCTQSTVKGPNPRRWAIEATEEAAASHSGTSSLSKATAFRGEQPPWMREPDIPLFWRPSAGGQTFERVPPPPRADDGSSIISAPHSEEPLLP